MAAALERAVKFLAPLRAPSFTARVNDRAEGQGFPRLADPRFFIRARKIERWRVSPAATPQRLVEGPGTGPTQARMDEKGGVDGRDEDGTSRRLLL